MLSTIKYNHRLYGLLLAIIFLSMMSSCKKDLEITPEVFVSPDELYKTEAGAIAGVLGVYRLVHEWKKSDYYFVGEVGTDEGKTTSFVPTWGGYWTHYTGINSYNNLLTAQNDLIQGLWVTLYKGIVNANTAIKFIPIAATSDGVKNKLIAEARFLRAVFYFQLVQFFGGVPMPTEAVNETADVNGYPKSTAEEVYALITGDLQFAVANLDVKSTGNVGHANKEAAIALLGKVYLTRKEYSQAETTLLPLLTSPNTGLMGSYADLFKEVNENNKESLFEIQYSNEPNNTNNIAGTLGGWHTNSTDSGGGGHVVIATDYYANSFAAGDQRKNASLRTVFYDANGNFVDYSWWADVGKPHVKKYDITKGVSRNSSESSRNLYYLRFADVILMYAEAANEQNKPDIALANLNKIRNRAGLANWETVLGHTPSQAELRAELLKERMRELGFEGWRWCDLKRTGTLLSQTIANNPDAAPNMTQKHLLLPIAAREFETNAAMKPSDQNPGY